MVHDAALEHKTHEQDSDILSDHSGSGPLEARRLFCFTIHNDGRQLLRAGIAGRKKGLLGWHSRALA